MPVPSVWVTRYKFPYTGEIERSGPRGVTPHPGMEPETRPMEIIREISNYSFPSFIGVAHYARPRREPCPHSGSNELSTALPIVTKALH